MRLGRDAVWTATLQRSSNDPECTTDDCELTILELGRDGRKRYLLLNHPSEPRMEASLEVVRRSDGAESLLAWGTCYPGSHELMVGAFLVEADPSGEPVLAWQGDIHHCSSEVRCRNRPPSLEYADLDHDGDLDLSVDPVVDDEDPNRSTRRTFSRDSAGKLESPDGVCAVR